MKVLKVKMLDMPLEIFLIEDNIGDVGLIKELFNDSKIRTNLHVAEDGEETVRFLCREDKFFGSLRPDMILLD